MSEPRRRRPRISSRWTSSSQHRSPFRDSNRELASPRWRRRPVEAEQQSRSRSRVRNRVSQRAGFRETAIRPKSSPPRPRPATALGYAGGAPARSESDESAGPPCRQGHGSTKCSQREELDASVTHQPGLYHGADPHPSLSHSVGEGIRTVASRLRPATALGYAGGAPARSESDELARPPGRQGHGSTKCTRRKSSIAQPQTAKARTHTRSLAIASSPRARPWLCGGRASEERKRRVGGPPA